MNKITLPIIFAITISLAFSLQDVTATHNGLHSTPCDEADTVGGGLLGTSPGPIGPPNSLGWDVGSGQCNGSFSTTTDATFPGGALELGLRAEERRVGQLAPSSPNNYEVQLGHDDTPAAELDRAWWNFQGSIAYEGDIADIDELTLTIITDVGPNPPVAPSLDLQLLRGFPTFDARNNQPNPTTEFADIFQFSQNPVFGWFANPADGDGFSDGFDYNEEGAWRFILSATEEGHTSSVSICIHTPGAQCKPTLTVIKEVVNDDGGTNIPSDFTMIITATNPSDNNFVGSNAGTTITIDAGPYSVDETGPANYDKTLSSECSGTAVDGDVLVCTITNDDVELFCGLPITAYNVIDGTNGDDDLDGTNGDDLIRGLKGNDDIDGKDGNDCLIGGKGNDDIHGGHGNDTIEGNQGKDKLSGSNGDDIISGGPGADKILGQNGNDTLNGDGGKDTIYGNEGDDIISGGPGADKILGQNGNDTIDGNGGADKIYGNSGNDILTGGKGKDVIYGQNGNDTIEGNEGKDKLFGNGGNDTLDGGPGKDKCSEGSGSDTLISCES